jgi:ferredoxin-NADP reductase
LAEIAKRRSVGLIAGGSGLTPMLQVAEEALRQKLPVQVWHVGLWSVDVQCWESNAGRPLRGWWHAQRGEDPV